MDDLRMDCLMRHENGNCTVIGGFCTAVNDSICEGLHSAYDSGYRAAALRANQERENPKPMTNAQKIRGMSDEELAEFLTHINPTNCQDCAFSHGWRCQPDRDDYSDFEKCTEGRKRWLQQPAKGETNNA